MTVGCREETDVRTQGKVVRTWGWPLEWDGRDDYRGNPATFQLRFEWCSLGLEIWEEEEVFRMSPNATDNGHFMTTDYEVRLLNVESVSQGVCSLYYKISLGF